MTVRYSLCQSKEMPFWPYKSFYVGCLCSTSFRSIPRERRFPNEALFFSDAFLESTFLLRPALFSQGVTFFRARLAIVFCRRLQATQNGRTCIISRTRGRQNRSVCYLSKYKIHYTSILKSFHTFLGK